MPRNLRPNSPPFPHRPLVWASPPTGDLASNSIIPAGEASSGPAGITSGMANAMSQATFSFRFITGPTTNVFPILAMQTTLGFTAPVGLISVELSTSASNQSSDGVIAVAVAKLPSNNIINLSSNTNIYGVHIIEAGFGHSMRSATTFADDVSPKFGSNEKLGLFLCSAGTGSANNLVTSVCTIRYFNLT